MVGFEKTIGISNLYEIRDETACPLIFILELKNNPMFENLRETKEYSHLIDDLMAKYQRKHNRIARLAEQNEKEPV